MKRSVTITGKKYCCVDRLHTMFSKWHLSYTHNNPVLYMHTFPHHICMHTSTTLFATLTLAKNRKHTTAQHSIPFPSLCMLSQENLQRKSWSPKNLTSNFVLIMLSTVPQDFSQWREVVNKEKKATSLVNKEKKRLHRQSIHRKRLHHCELGKQLDHEEHADCSTEPKLWKAESSFAQRRYLTARFGLYPIYLYYTQNAYVTKHMEIIVQKTFTCGSNHSAIASKLMNQKAWIDNKQKPRNQSSSTFTYMQVVWSKKLW